MNSTESAPLLAIEGVTIGYRQGRNRLDAVRDVSLTVGSGEIVGLVGESGSGKSTLAHAVLRYLSPNGAVTAGTIRFRGQDIGRYSPAELRAYWREQVKLVPQNALSALNPSLTIGDQVLEAIPPGPQHNRQQMLERLTAVRLADPARVARSYPHQLSGGMQQRVMIAMALAGEPALLVMDEPTTALDVTTEAAILDLVADLIRERDTAVLYVTHDLNVVAQVCHRVAVLYAGELVEDAIAADLFTRPLHPYTAGLIAGVPQVGLRKGSRKLNPIRGSIPQLTDLPPGCVFAPRCPVAIDRCHPERPPLDRVPTHTLPTHTLPTDTLPTGTLPATAGGDDAALRRVRCFLWPDIAQGELQIVEPDARQRISPTASAPAPQAHPEDVGLPALTVDGLEKRFESTRSVVEWLGRRAARPVRAVDGIELRVKRGRTLGLVGESGSGKTTLARCIIGLEEADSGEIRLLDVPIAHALDKRTPDILRQLQIVFQNPDEALNPYRTVADTLRRPLARLGRADAQAGQTIEERIGRLLAMVNLRPELAHRLPGQLSGGEKQRVAIARAFAAQPELLIFDESVSALDVSVQASILNLLNELQAEQERAYLFITHDLGVVSYLADELAVIYLGRLMDVGNAENFFAPPYHPYTEALLAAAPKAVQSARAQNNAESSAITVPTAEIRLGGEVPSPQDVPDGCPFHSRCPRVLGEICATEAPPWHVTAEGRRIFCHIPPHELAQLQAAGEIPPQDGLP